MRKLITMVIATIGLFTLMATTVSAHGISYSRYQDKRLDHYNQSSSHYHNTSRYDTAYFDNYYYYDARNNFAVSHYLDYDINIDLDNRYDYVVQPFIYDLYYDDYYISRTFPKSVNYYFPPAYYYY